MESEAQLELRASLPQSIEGRKKEEKKTAQLTHWPAAAHQTDLLVWQVTLDMKWKKIPSTAPTMRPHTRLFHMKTLYDCEKAKNKALGSVLHLDRWQLIKYANMLHARF